MTRLPKTRAVTWGCLPVLFFSLIPAFASGHEGSSGHFHLAPGITLSTFGTLILLVCVGFVGVAIRKRSKPRTALSSRNRLLELGVFLFFCASPMAAFGHHVMDTDKHPIVGGFSLPFHGADHFIAMVAVGLFAASKTKWRWAFPASFMAFMLIGMVMGFARLSIPYVETGIWVSVIAFGLILAVLARMPNAITAVLVGGFGIFHGYACGADIPNAWSPWLFGTGLVACTIALIGLGFLVGGVVWKFIGEFGIRVAGAIAALIMAGLLVLPMISSS
ncbi:MAG: HupE/UreJ family protein [Verrucomicrobiota bacterium]